MVFNFPVISFRRSKITGWEEKLKHGFPPTQPTPLLFLSVLYIGVHSNILLRDYYTLEKTLGESLGLQGDRTSQS